MASRLTDDQRRTETAGNVVSDTTIRACIGVSDVIVTMINAYEDDGVGGVKAEAIAWIGVGERANQGVRVREVIVNQGVTCRI